MKTIIRTLLFSLLTISTAINLKAQAIKVDYIGYSGVCGSYSKPFFWGVGYDHNLGDKISIGLTYRHGYALDNETNNQLDYSFQMADNANIAHQVNFSVGHLTTWHEFAYTSKYFFNDNSDGGMYFLTGLSLLQANNTYNVFDISEDQIYTTKAFDVTEGIYEQKITLFPVNLDLGGRGEFDGWYFEYNFGVGLLPFGSKKDVEPASLSNHGVETRFSSVSFHVGLSFGVSWAE